MPAAIAGASIPGVTHHRINVNGTDLHYVEAGSYGSPVLLVHGFPETWWDVPRGDPASRREPSGVRSRPARLRRLRQRR